MDFFGIGQALKGVMLTYFHASRQTGRTTTMIDSVKDGDRICFSNHQEANRVKNLCKQRGLQVQCVVVPVNNPGKVFASPSSQGRTIFDHSWIEDFYMKRLDECQAEIKHLETQASGYGAAHRKTKEEAIEFSFERKF